MGFDRVDRTICPDGHVKPERVAQGRPPFVQTIRQHGLQVVVVTPAHCGRRVASEGVDLGGVGQIIFQPGSRSEK